jgi:hypothetical protein
MQNDVEKICGCLGLTYNDRSAGKSLRFMLGFGMYVML